MLSAGRSGWLKAAGLALAILAFDLGSKAFVSDALALGERHQLSDHVAVLPVHNPGLRLSFINGGFHLPFYVDLIGMVLIAAFLLTHPPQRFLWLGCGLLIGGGLGNQLELLYHGYATDFIQIGDWRLIFNLADVALVLYAVFLIALLGRAVLGRHGSAPPRPPTQIGALGP